MPFQIEAEYFDGAVKLLQTVSFPDDRGYFMEVYRQDHFHALGITDQPFIQDNHSRSTKGVIRGLHFQHTQPMAKLMRVTVGTALLVAVDIRKGSPTLGQYVLVEASAENKKQLWAPPSFARGFCVLSEVAEIQYKCTAIYNKAGESGLRWNDPQINIPWPVENPILSPKDEQAPTLAEWLTTPEADLFRYEAG
jgi:dTDP-4-dehydrorhamnose 3,5-epimerase